MKIKGILDKESQKGIWILNANLLISKGSTFYINSSDTTWLKIRSDGKTAYSIDVFGTLIVNSVKISSWNPSTNSYTNIDDNESIPRPFIKVEAEATGTTNIINSEIAYLGYQSGHSLSDSGISYYGGNGSKLTGNNIHHLQTGFYSSGVRDLLYENNTSHNNYHYGLDPHTGTHNMTIRNNAVYNNGEEGIICSLDCYNILVENNEVYKNSEAGILFSRSMHNSIARGNNVHDEPAAIFLSASYNNSVYGNKISNVKNGIYLKDGSYSNIIRENTIANASLAALHVASGASKNNIYSNSLQASRGYAVIIENSSTVNNTLVANKISSLGDGARLYDNQHTSFVGNRLGSIRGYEYVLSKGSILNLKSTNLSHDKIKQEKTSENEPGSSVSILNSGKITVRNNNEKNGKTYDTKFSNFRYDFGKPGNSNLIILN